MPVHYPPAEAGRARLTPKGRNHANEPSPQPEAENRSVFGKSGVARRFRKETVTRSRPLKRRRGGAPPPDKPGNVFQPARWFRDSMGRTPDPGFPRVTPRFCERRDLSHSASVALGRVGRRSALEPYYSAGAKGVDARRSAWRCGDRTGQAREPTFHADEARTLRVALLSVRKAQVDAEALHVRAARAELAVACVAAIDDAAGLHPLRRLERHLHAAHEVERLSVGRDRPWDRFASPLPVSQYSSVRAGLTRELHVECPVGCDTEHSGLATVAHECAGHVVRPKPVPRLVCVLTVSDTTNAQKQKRTHDATPHARSSISWPANGQSSGVSAPVTKGLSSGPGCGGR